MKCTFMDNAEYTAQDVNNVYSKLTSAGVVIFTDTGNALSDFNAANADITASGVTANPDACSVIKEDGVYKISPGACFMADGSLAELTEAEEITVPEGTACYVYFERCAEENTIKITVSETQGGENSVSLAGISASGEITDKRKFAQMKIAPSGENVGVSGTLKGTLAAGVEKEVNVGFAGFKYFIYDSGKAITSLGGKLVTDISDGEKHLIYTTYNGGSEGYIRKDGSKLYISGSGNNVPLYLDFEVR